MTPLRSMLDEMGLAQYAQAFADEGFDTWTTLMDITESDLEALGVKLGHRRKLQRAIVDTRGRTRDNFPMQALPSPSQEESKSNMRPKCEQPHDHQSQVNQRTQAKRKYRRHPKPDEHAPERPPSAYVIFSNQMREVLKGRDLSFTEIAKLVGERWQSLDLSDKEPCERQAQEMKEKYYTELSEYKKTDRYSTYQKYLNEFKAKHNPQQNPKRPRTDGHATPSRHGSSRERTMDDGASRTDESTREGASPGSATQEAPFQRPDNPAVLQWRSAVEPPIISAKVSPTAHSPRASSFRRSAYEDSSTSGDTPDSLGRNLPVHTVGSGFPRLDPRSSSQDIRRRESLGWQASNVSASLPSLTREDTTKTAQSSDLESAPDRWSRLGNSPPSLDNQKTPFAGGRILPVPPGFAKAGFGASNPHGSSTTRQPQRSSIHDAASRQSSTHYASSTRSGDEHSNPQATSPHEGHYSQTHSRNISASQDSERWTNKASQNEEDQHYQQQKARASMGLATLLRASEHLEDKPNQSAQPRSPGAKRK